MRVLRPVAAVVAALLALGLAPASAKILIQIDKSTQRMTVSHDGERLYVWPVSTGQRGYDTPSGTFTPFRMEKDHFSKEWDDAPMPHSIFFTMKGHAIHGTEHLKNIGRPASHGCVRLEPENARVLFSMVKQEGMSNVKVVLFGQTGSGAPAMARRAPAYVTPTSADDEDATAAASAQSAPPSWGQSSSRGYEGGFPPPPPPFFGDFGRPY